MDSSVPVAALDQGFASVPPPGADHGCDEAPVRDPSRGRQQGPRVHNAAAEPFRPHSLMQGEVVFSPRTPEVSADPWKIPCPDPRGGSVLPPDLEAWVDGIRASTRRSTPVGVLLSRGRGDRRQCLARDRLSGPVPAGWERPWALRAVVLGEIDPLQGCRPITPPSAEVRDRSRVLRWGVPEVPLHPRRLLASRLGHPLDGDGAHGTRVDPPIAQALDLAPRPWLNRLDETAWQGPHPAMTGSPVAPGPRGRCQAQGRVSCWTTPGHLRLG